VNCLQLSASSSQQDALTPTSTLTSQGSHTTPTPGSPSTASAVSATPAYGTLNGFDSSLYSNLGGGNGVYGAFANGGSNVRHTIKVPPNTHRRQDDIKSFNNETRQTTNNGGEYATSVV
jgi:hypothetical protein